MESKPLCLRGLICVDLKENYDVSTVLRAAGYFSVLYLDKSPKELMATIQHLAKELLMNFMSVIRLCGDL